MNYFLQIYGTLPRAGPGSNDLTRRAFQLVAPHLPSSPRILDLGCGPGVQTLELLALSSKDLSSEDRSSEDLSSEDRSRGTVVAVDLIPQMLERTRKAAEDAGLDDRLETLQQDMGKMSFVEQSFDLIWSEGAIYNLGFEEGLKTLRPLVKSGGFVAVSEVVWLRPDPPAEIQTFWQEYPEIQSVDAKLGIVDRLGYEIVGHFVFPPEAWTEHYYSPMEEKIAEKRAEWSGDEEAKAVLDEAENEISMFRKYYEYYSYAFFVMRRRPTP